MAYTDVKSQDVRLASEFSYMAFDTHGLEPFSSLQEYNSEDISQLEKKVKLFEITRPRKQLEMECSMALKVYKRTA